MDIGYKDIIYKRMLEGAHLMDWEWKHLATLFCWYRDLAEMFGDSATEDWASRNLAKADRMLRIRAGEIGY